MTIKEAVYQRHTVRRFRDEAIPQELLDKLRAHIEEINRNNELAITLSGEHLEDLYEYYDELEGRGIRYYIVLAGKDCPELLGKFGYFGADIALYAQTLGLNTWWVGGFDNKNSLDRSLDLDSIRASGLLLLGYGTTQGVQHPLRKAEEIGFYEGEAPQWFKDGIETLLYAPTGHNRLAYTVKGEGSKVSISYGPHIRPEIERGIGKYFFELGAGKENFEWV